MSSVKKRLVKFFLGILIVNNIGMSMAWSANTNKGQDRTRNRYYRLAGGAGLWILSETNKAKIAPSQCRW